MRPRTPLYTLAVLAVGALLGYVGSSSQLNPVWQARAETPPNSAVAGKADAAGDDSARVENRRLLARATGLKGQPPTVQPAKSVEKPNVLVIMGDDIGWYNPSCYHRGDMGYETPNIDRIAREGAMFLSW